MSLCGMHWETGVDGKGEAPVHRGSCSVRRRRL